MSTITLFVQIIKKIDRSVFKKLVEKHHSDKGNKGFDSWTHLVSMLFCHFAKSTISNGLRFATGNLNHLGVIKGSIKIKYKLKHRTFYLFKDLYYELVGCLGQHWY